MRPYDIEHDHPYYWEVTQVTSHAMDAGEIQGPRDVVDFIQKEPKALNAVHSWPVVEWRAKDDDGDVYAYGKLYGKDVHGFEPLDDYFGPAYGCTTIDHKENGLWEML